MPTTHRLIVASAIALATSMLVASDAHALWQPDGIPLTHFSPTGITPLGPELASDGTGGIFVVWNPGGSGANHGREVWAVRVKSDGSVASGWPTSGLVIASAPSYTDNVESIDDATPDAAGGAFVQYHPFYAHPTPRYLAHVTASGADPGGWNGAISTSDPAIVAADDSGGCLTAYHRYSSISGPTPVEFDHNNPDGSSAGSLQPETTQSAVDPSIDTDNAGGAFACSFCNARRLDAAMSELWAVAPWPGCDSRMTVASDGGSGAYLAWVSGTSVMVTRIDDQGAAAAGWTQAGIVAGSDVAAGQPIGLTRDGTGGLFVEWHAADGRHVQRIVDAGSVAPGWDPEGFAIDNSASFVPDGSGGLWIAWIGGGNGVTNVRATHLSGSGAPASGWIATGNPICTTPGSHDHVVAASDDAGGAYFAWRDGRYYGYPLAYGQHVLADDQILLDVPPRRGEALSISTLANPSLAGIACSFTLPTADVARLDVFDAAGRRVNERTISDATAGAHFESLGIQRPGVYLIRLTQAGRTAATRAVVIR